MSAVKDTTKVEELVEKHDMVLTLLEQYRYDHIVAVRHASQIQRELSRAEHEVARVERHIQRIEAFCKKNNVPFDN